MDLKFKSELIEVYISIRCQKPITSSGLIDLQMHFIPDR